MNATYSYRDENSAFAKVLLVTAVLLGLIMAAVLYMFDETILVGEVCCVKAANDARLGRGVLVEVFVENGEAVLVSWQSGIAIMPGRKAEILQIKNVLTGGISYSLMKYVPTDA
jgi:hypothetical protein